MVYKKLKASWDHAAGTLAVKGCFIWTLLSDANFVTWIVRRRMHNFVVAEIGYFVVGFYVDGCLRWQRTHCIVKCFWPMPFTVRHKYHQRRPRRFGVKRLWSDSEGRIYEVWTSFFYSWRYIEGHVLHPNVIYSLWRSAGASYQRRYNEINVTSGYVKSGFCCISFLLQSIDCMYSERSTC